MSRLFRRAALAAACSFAAAFSALAGDDVLWWEVPGDVALEGGGVASLAQVGADSARIRVTGGEGVDEFLPLYADDGFGDLYLSDFTVADVSYGGVFFASLGEHAQPGRLFSLELGAWCADGSFWCLARTAPASFASLADCISNEDDLLVGAVPESVWTPSAFARSDDEPGDGQVPEGAVSAYDVTVVHDGAAHGLDASAFAGVQIGGQSAAVSFALSAEGPWQAESPTLTDVGSLTVWYRLSASGYADYVHAAKITVKEAVARVVHGSEIAFYDEVQRALAAAADGDRVTLLVDVTLVERLEVDPGAEASVVFDLGGRTLSTGGACAEAGAIDVKSGTVAIENGAVDGAASGAVAQGAITAENGAVVTLRTLDVEVDSAAGACVYACAGGSVSIESGRYVNSTGIPLSGSPERTGQAVAQAEGDAALISIAGGTFAKVDPALGGPSGRPATFVRDGYISVGAVDASGTTLYTVYEKVTVTFEPGNGDSATAVDLGKGFSVAEPAEPTRAGYTFSGWQKDGMPYDFTDAVNEDVTLTATWTIVIPDVLKSREIFDEFRSWLITHGLEEADVSDEGVVAAVTRVVPTKGTTLVDEFIAGTDPLDETSRLLALISMSGRKPIITWTPNLNDGEGERVGVRTYRVWGVKALGDAWEEVPEGKESDYQFFKVSVSL